MSGTTDGRPSLYFDTNAFIEAFEGRGATSALLGEILAFEPPRDPPLVVTSELTLAELLVKPLELGRQDLASLYEASLTGNAHVRAVTVSRDVLKRAAALRAHAMRLKLPDAVHLATALEVGCTHFVSNDAGLQFPGMRFVRFLSAELSTLMEEVGRGRGGRPSNEPHG